VRPVGAKLKDGNRKFHTLHCGRTHIFTIQKNGTSVVAFRNKNDVHQFGKLLESHFELSRSWPTINFEDVILFKKTKDIELVHLSVLTWKESDLVNFCIENYMNMLDIYRVEDEYRLVGRAISWEAPMPFYVDTLNKKLE
jgi:hypothetical protein